MKIVKPALLLDEIKCRNNLKRMNAKARASNTVFRPHFKTHQSADIGKWFREAGIDCITVSSVSMAAYFSHRGWNNILIAFPFNICETDSVNELPIMTEIFLTVESVETVKHLSRYIARKINLYIKIDTGYHRTGLLPENNDAIRSILEEININENLQFTGFLAHFGNTYNAHNKKEIEQIYQDSTRLLQNLKVKYKSQFQNLIISIGDTPSCSIADSFIGVDEIRPGNFIFYDLMQYQLGACNINDIAVALACPVTAIHRQRNEIVIYGGGVHLSKEYMFENDGIKSFGKVVELKKNGWGAPVSHTFVSGLSQEHGIIATTAKFIKKIKIGDIIGILPVHSCMTANLAYSYLSLDNTVLKKYTPEP